MGGSIATAYFKMEEGKDVEVKLNTYETVHTLRRDR